VSYLRFFEGFSFEEGEKTPREGRDYGKFKIAHGPDFRTGHTPKRGSISRREKVPWGECISL